MKPIEINAVPMSFEKTFQIKLENINQVYIGKLDWCRCGCGGDYLQTKQEADRINKEAGRRLVRSNEKKILSAINKFASADYQVKFMEWENEFCLEIQTHLDEDDDKCGITIYLRYDDEFNINKYKTLEFKLPQSPPIISEN